MNKTYFLTKWEAIMKITGDLTGDLTFFFCLGTTLLLLIFNSIVEWHTIFSANLSLYCLLAAIMTKLKWDKANKAKEEVDGKVMVMVKNGENNGYTPDELKYMLYKERNLPFIR